MDADSPFAHEGDVPDPDGIGESGSMDAGPGVRIALRLGPDRRVADARFRTAAFEEARAVASALCHSLVGATIEEAGRVSANAVAKLAGIAEGSAAARTVYFAKCAALLPHLGRGAYTDSGVTCVCFGIETERIRDTIREHGLTTVDELKRHLPASSGCGTCRPEIEELLAEENEGR